MQVGAWQRAVKTEYDLEGRMFFFLKGKETVPWSVILISPVFSF